MEPTRSVLSELDLLVLDGVTGNRVWLSLRESPVSEGFGHGILYAF